jgi:hypothetical protein
MVYGNEFVVNHLPLDEGENTIVATANDTAGTTETASITLYATTPQEHIKITANAESAIAPVEITLTIESSLDLSDATLTYTGPSEVEFLSSSLSEYRVGITTEGIYYFTISAKAPNGDPYADTVAIVIFSEGSLDALLRSKWEQMRWSLSRNDIENAVRDFDEFSKDAYKEMFTALSSLLPQIAQDLSDIQLIADMKNAVEYDIRTIKNGKEYSYHLLFVRDKNGLWKIRSF